MAVNQDFFDKLRQEIEEEFARKEAEQAALDEIIGNKEQLLEESVPSDSFGSYIIKGYKEVINILTLVAHMGRNQMPIFIKFVRALQQVGYMKNDCFDNIDEFIKNASEQFNCINFDKANVKKQIAIGSRMRDEEYDTIIKDIATYLEPVING